MATKTSLWRERYELAEAESFAAAWESRLWRWGGALELPEGTFQAAANFWRTRFTLTDSRGVTIATAERAGRKNWTVGTATGTYRFRRATWRGEHQSLVSGDREVGSIRRTSTWRGHATADLPSDMPLPVRVFCLVVVLAVWEVRRQGSVS